MDDKIKSEIIDREMTKFWHFCNTQMINHEDYPVIPQSLMTFSELFLKNLTKMLE